MSEAVMSKVGIATGGDGTQTQVRAGKQSETIVSQAHGKYFEPSSRGYVFGASDQGTGVAPGTTLSTTACLTLYNPQGSGKRLVIHKVSVAYRSGTLGTGVMFHCLNTSATQTVPSGGTAMTVVCLDAGASPASVGVPRTGGTVVAPTAIRPFTYLPPMLATSVLGLATVETDIDGEIVVEPGCSYQLQSVAAAGTSPLVCPSISWEEVPII